MGSEAIEKLKLFFGNGGGKKIIQWISWIIVLCLALALTWVLYLKIDIMDPKLQFFVSAWFPASFIRTAVILGVIFGVDWLSKGQTISVIMDIKPEDSVWKIAIAAGFLLGIAHLVLQACRLQM